MRQLSILTSLLLCLLSLGCGSQPQTVVEDPTLAPRKSHMPTCRWVPVAPEWNEPCSAQNQGAKLEVTLREGARPEDAQKQTATCECN